MLKSEIELSKSNELLRTFWNLQKNLMDAIQKTATTHGLSVPQYAILMTLVHHQEITQKMMREKTNLPKSTLSQAVNDLVKLGILDRNPVEGDRREILLSMNSKGKELIQTIYKQKNGVHQLFHQSIESLSNEQLTELVKILTHITSYFDELGSE